jgi:hypothetical protein
MRRAPTGTRLPDDLFRHAGLVRGAADYFFHQTTCIHQGFVNHVAHCKIFGIDSSIYDNHAGWRTGSMVQGVTISDDEIGEGWIVDSIRDRVGFALVDGT